MSKEKRTREKKSLLLSLKRSFLKRSNLKNNQLLLKKKSLLWNNMLKKIEKKLALLMRL